MIQPYKFQKIAILGSGTMGAQIAAYLANLNIPTIIFDMQIALLDKNIANLAKANPPVLADNNVLDFIEKATYEHHPHKLKECDFVLEAVVENLNIKKQLLAKLHTYINPDAIIATNTSSLSIASISEQLPKSLQKKFCGVHFFNPPRFMSLVELIPSPRTSADVLEKLEGFITAYLGKEVVHAKDSPGFIGNRIGVISWLTTLHHAEALQLPPDQVDALTGKLIGKAKSATYRAADLVGLDILKNVVDYLAQQQIDTSWQAIMRLPTWLEHLISQGNLGQKNGKGVYWKKGGDIYVYDPKLGDYRLRNTQISKETMKFMRSKNSLAKLLKKMAQSKHPEQQLLWRTHRDSMHYAALHVNEIAHNIVDVDRALKAGFGWKRGLFELWQEAGIQTVNQLIGQAIENNLSISSTPLPRWLNSLQNFTQNGSVFSPETQSYVTPKQHPIYQRQIHANTFPVILETDAICLNEVEDGVAAIHFKTKLASINYGVLQGINQAIDCLEEQGYGALIFWSKVQGFFCVGANLYQILIACKLGRLYNRGGMKSKTLQKAFELANPNLPKIDYEGAIVDVSHLGQQTMMRLKHGPLLTIAAVDGLALGGGCELILHCKQSIATLDSYIGLVEVGVGILPAFGGTKEMILRSQTNQDQWSLAKKYFEQIAMAKVSNSALEAQHMNYLKRHTPIIANYNELLFSAIELAKSSLKLAQYNVSKNTLIKPLGFSGEATILGQLVNFYEGKYMSEHDYVITQKIAKIFGGQVTDGEQVTAQWLLDLERKYFMQLLETEKTQARIEYMLKNNKALRN